MEAWEGRSHVEGGEVEQPFKNPPLPLHRSRSHHPVGSVEGWWLLGHRML